MKRLGISVYFQESSLEELKDYIDKAHINGFELVFISLKFYEGEELEKYTKLLKYINAKNMTIYADTVPEVLTQLGVSDFTDLSIIEALGIHGIRLDAAYTGNEEALLTYNKQNIKVILNMCIGKRYFDNVMLSKPVKSNLMGCHNFYPRKYTGISHEYYTNTSQTYVDSNIPTGAFVHSNAAKTAPEPIEDGLVTIEAHRYMTMRDQIKELHFTELCDDIIIANAFASLEELVEASKINLEMKEFEVEFDDEVDTKIIDHITNKILMSRGDPSPYCHRTSTTRTEEFAIEPNQQKGQKFMIQRGDVTIDNKLYGRYNGEVQIALQEMESSEKVNIIGKVSERDLFLLDYINAYDKFKLKKRQ